MVISSTALANLDESIDSNNALVIRMYDERIHIQRYQLLSQTHGQARDFDYGIAQRVYISRRFPSETR